MAKGPSLSDITNITTGAPTINANNNEIENAFENTLSLDGSTPNSMAADLDLDSNDLLNVGVTNTSTLFVGAVEVTPTDLLVVETPDWQGGWATATAYLINDLVAEEGSTYICLESHTSGTFSTDLSALKWELFAAKGNTGAGTGDLLAINDLSDVTTPATALANLGGQPLDANLNDVANNGTTAGLAIVTAANAAAQRTLLDVYSEAETDTQTLGGGKVWGAMTSMTLATSGSNSDYQNNSGYPLVVIIHFTSGAVADFYTNMFCYTGATIGNTTLVASTNFNNQYVHKTTTIVVPDTHYFRVYKSGSMGTCGASFSIYG